MKTVLFTFDYELFLGERSGNVNESIIEPTNWLVKQLNKHSYKGIFFVDTIYLLRLREVSGHYKAARTDFEVIYNQLVAIAGDGHEIHPHLHPHWLDAVYYPQTNDWSLVNQRYYQFTNLPEEERKNYFSQSIQLIQQVLQSANVSQRVDAYRAGGWAIQPFEEFRPYFLKHGIKHDFSVIPGKYFFSDVSYHDFRPALCHIPYRFDMDICMPDTEGLFTEWPISTNNMGARITWLNFKIDRVFKAFFKPRKISGSVYKPNVKEKGDIYEAKNGWRMTASFEWMNPFLVLRYLRLVYKNDYFQFISHPKLVFKTEKRMLPLFLRLIKLTGRVETNFRKSKYNV